VSEVHALVCGSLAPESYGLVLDEARELGLPALLPCAGAFVERAREGEGVLFYASGDAGSLGCAILRLAKEEGLLEELRARIPRDAAPRSEEIVRRTRELHLRARDAGPPEESALPREEWFATRLAQAELAHWDEALARSTPRALGLEGKP
jgi:glycosyltransferase involved in cell wall biosynthesis